MCKFKWIEWHWFKINNFNCYDYFLCKMYILYSGKRIFYKKIPDNEKLQFLKALMQSGNFYTYV